MGLKRLPLLDTEAIIKRGMVMDQRDRAHKDSGNSLQSLWWRYSVTRRYAYYSGAFMRSSGLCWILKSVIPSPKEMCKGCRMHFFHTSDCSSPVYVASWPGMGSVSINSSKCEGCKLISLESLVCCLSSLYS